MASKKGPFPLCLFTLHQKRAPIFYTCYTKILLAESNSNFYFVWKFASAWKPISHCKLFEVIWFYTVLYLCIKVVKGPPLAYIFALFWKTYDLLQSVWLLSGSSAFKQNNAWPVFHWNLRPHQWEGCVLWETARAFLSSWRLVCLVARLQVTTLFQV